VILLHTHAVLAVLQGEQSDKDEAGGKGRNRGRTTSRLNLRLPCLSLRRFLSSFFVVSHLVNTPACLSSTSGPCRRTLAPPVLNQFSRQSCACSQARFLVLRLASPLTYLILSSHSSSLVFFTDQSIQLPAVCPFPLRFRSKSPRPLSFPKPPLKCRDPSSTDET
jgi:hypothetical protein